VCRENEEEREMTHARDVHEDLSKRIALLEWKAVEDNMRRLRVEEAGDTGACLYVVCFLLPYPLANRRACKSTGSV
jgi:hypothetical protein